MFRYRNDSTNQSDLGDFKRPHHCRFLVYGEPLVFFIVQLSTCLICEPRLQKTRTRRKRRKGGSLLILMKHPLKWCLDPRKGHPIAEGMYGHETIQRSQKSRWIKWGSDPWHHPHHPHHHCQCKKWDTVFFRDSSGPIGSNFQTFCLHHPQPAFHILSQRHWGWDPTYLSANDEMCPENPSCSLKDLFLIYVWYILLIWFGDGSKWLTTFGGTWWDQIMTEARWFHKFRWALGELLLPPRILLKMMLVFCPWPIIWRMFYEFMLP